MTPGRAIMLFMVGSVLAGVAATLSSSGGADAASASGCPSTSPPVIRDGFPEPAVRTSRNGVLETTLRASYSPVKLDGRRYRTLNYEGSVPGPTLVVCPGDRLVVQLENDLGKTPEAWAPQATMGEHDVPHGAAQLTNLHTHGFHVSPRGVSDNVFLSVAAGKRLTHRYRIPRDHPPGLYWYHPHRHGFVEAQVYAGMLGTMYVRGGLDRLRALRDVPTRTLAIHSLQLGRGRVVPVADSVTEKSPYFINGTLNPRIRIRPGQLQRWRILNGNANAIVRLALQGHKLYLLANDGNTLERMTPRKQLLIGPGERRELLVRGGRRGRYKLESLPFAQFQGGRLPASTIATVVSRGPRRHDALPGRRLTRQQEDLRDAKVAQRHRIVFSERQVGDDEFEFLLNGKVFDPERVDETMKLGEVNEWTLVNTAAEWHTFHIHINDFQVTAYKPGKQLPRVSYGRPRDVAPRDIDPEDSVKLPPGGTVTLRTRPTDFTGKFVFHCHMLNHEDRGMMGVVRVSRRR